MKFIQHYILAFLFGFTANLSIAQVFKGTVSYWKQTAPCTLKLNADSSLYFVRNDVKNEVYEQYSGFISKFHNDLYRLRTRKPVRREGWGLYDTATGKEYRYAQVLIDSFHRKTFAPVFVLYDDGTKEEYLFKGQMKLDTLKLNAAHPTYTLSTQHSHLFTQKPLNFTGTFTNNICFLNDTSGVDVMIRFKRDSLITVPSDPYLQYNYYFRLRQNAWQQQPRVKTTPKTFTYPDIKRWRIEGDSLVYSDEIEYAADTVFKKEINQYYKSRFVSSHEVSRENGLVDSALYINVFDQKGNLQRIITRWFSELWCDSSLYNGEGYDQWVDYGERIDVEEIHYPCPRYAYSIIDYKKDSIGTKRNLSYNHEFKTMTVAHDTTWYYSNGMKRMEKSYNDTALNYVWRFSYKYDNNGKLKEYSSRTTHAGGYQVAQLWRLFGKDTILVKSSTRYRADTTSSEYIVYNYDPEKRIGWFKTYLNGKVIRYSVLYPAPEGCAYGSVTKSFDQDSVVMQTDEVYCLYEKRSKGMLEQWSSGRDQAYYRIDTMKTKAGYIVTTRVKSVYMVYPDFKSEPKESCEIKSIEVQDQFRRPVLFTEYENNRTIVKRKVRYTYSK